MVYLAVDVGISLAPGPQACMNLHVSATFTIWPLTLRRRAIGRSSLSEWLLHVRMQKKSEQVGFRGDDLVAQFSRVGSGYLYGPLHPHHPGMAEPISYTWW